MFLAPSRQRPHSSLRFWVDVFGAVVLSHIEERCSLRRLASDPHSSLARGTMLPALLARDAHSSLATFLRGPRWWTSLALCSVTTAADSAGLRLHHPEVSIGRHDVDGRTVTLAVMSGIYIVVPEPTDLIPVLGWLEEGLALLSWSLRTLGVKNPLASKPDVPEVQLERVIR